MPGVIYGVGVGIGDPGDLTLKAVAKIKESDVLILPRKDISKCRAYNIARSVIPEIEQIEKLALEFPMSKDAHVREENHRKIYETAKSLVLEGKTVTFLTIGDPALFSTFMYIARLAEADGIRTVAISGVSSVTACANALGINLCDSGQQLHVIPDTDDIRSSLDLPGTKLIMKCGRDILLIKEILKDRPVSVYAVSDCGMPEEKCYYGLDELPDEGNYMLTLIVKDRS